MAKKAGKKITDVTADPVEGAAPEPVSEMSLGEQLETLDAALQEQQGVSLVNLLNQLAHTRGVGVNLD